MSGKSMHVGKINNLEKRTNQFKEGMVKILPVASSGIVDGVVFGILAVQAGLSIFEAMLFSLLINAGSSQFAAVGLLSQGILGWPMLVSTALLNARQMLYGLSLGRYLKNTAPWKLSLMAAQLNDETFAVKITHVTSGRKPSLAFFFGASITDYIIWNASTLAGTVLGRVILQPEAWGLDFAFVATFLGFLAVSIKSPFYGWVAVASSLFACVGYWLGGFTAAVIFGTITAMIMGVFLHE